MGSYVSSVLGPAESASKSALIVSPKRHRNDDERYCVVT